MFVGVGRVEFFIHHANSLKAKRQVVRKLTDLVRNKFNVACAEGGRRELVAEGR